MKYPLALTLSSLLLAQPLRAGTGYVVNSADNSVTYFNTLTNLPQGTLPVGRVPQDIGIAGTIGYVVNNYDNTVSYFNTYTHTATGTFSVGVQPYAIAINGTTGYVVNFGTSTASTVSVFDASLATPPYATFAVGVQPRAIALSGGTGFVANTGDNTLTYFDTTTHTVLGTLAVGHQPIGMAISGTTGYVVNKGDNTLTYFNAETPTVLGSITVGNGPVDVDIIGTTGYVVNNLDNTVSYFNTTTNTLLGSITTGLGPRYITINGSNAYVSNSDNNNVTIFNTSSNTVLGSSPMSVGAYPQGMMIDPGTPTPPSVFSWTGQIDPNWANPQNWDGVSIPLAGSVARFPVLSSGTTTVSVTFNNCVADYLVFETDGYLLTANVADPSNMLLTLYPSMNGTAIDFEGSTVIGTAQIVFNSGGVIVRGSSTSSTITNQANISCDRNVFDITGSGALTLTGGAFLAGTAGPVTLSQGQFINNGASFALATKSLIITQETVTNTNSAFISRDCGYIILSSGAVISNIESSSIGCGGNDLVISGATLTNDATSIIGPISITMSLGTLVNTGIIYNGLSLLHLYSPFSSLHAQISEDSITGPGIYGGSVTGTGSMYLAQTHTFSTPVTQGSVIVGYGVTNGIWPITSGTLSGTLYANSTLNAEVLVTGSGTLVGSGAIFGTVTVQAGGVLSPGDLGHLADSLNIHGNVLLESNSYTQIDFDPSGVYDTLTLTGGNLSVQPQASLQLEVPVGFIPTAETYVLVQVNNTSSLLKGGISGTFTFAPPPSGWEAYELRYLPLDNPTQIVLSKNIPFTTLAGSTPNQQAVASALDTLNDAIGTSACLQHKINELELLRGQELWTILNQLEPSQLKGMQIVLEELAFVLNNEISDQLYNFIQKDEITGLLNDTQGLTQTLKPFILAGYERLSQGSYNQYEGFSANAGYELAGISFTQDSARLLIALGAQETGVHYRKIPSHASSTSVIGILGAAGFSGRWIAGFDALFGYHFIDTSRTIDYFDLTAHSEHNSYSLKGQFHAAYQKVWKSSTLTPYNDTAYLYGHEEKYIETGAECLNLNVNSSRRQVFRNTLGLNWEVFSVEALRPFIDLAYVFEQRWGGKNYTTYFIDTDPSMFIQGANSQKNYAKIGFGFKGSKNRWDYAFKYNGQAGKNFKENGFSFTLDRNF